MIVLAAFLSRFKLDADIQSTKESIDSQIPFIESLKADEILIKQTQLQLTNIKSIRQESPDYGLIIKKIADQTPGGVIIDSLSISKTTGKLDLIINGTAKNNNELTTFLLGLRDDKSFSDVNITSAGLEQNLINFTITTSVGIGGAKL